MPGEAVQHSVLQGSQVNCARGATRLAPREVELDRADLEDRCSLRLQTATRITNSIAMAASTAQPWRVSPTSRGRIQRSFRSNLL